MMFFEDETKLKIVLYVMLLLSVVALIGLWELFVKPGAIFLVQTFGPAISQIWHTVFK